MSELDLMQMAREQEAHEDTAQITSPKTGPHYGGDALKELKDFVWGWSESELDGHNARTEMRSTEN